MAAPLEVLPALPAMGATFARALIPGPKRPPALPEQAVMVAGHAQDPVRFAGYARVCGFTLRDHVPPTWLHVLTFPLHLHLLTDPAATLRVPGLVHVSNSMVLHRPVSVTEPLDLVVRAGNLRPHRRGVQLDLLGEVRVGDDLVWEGVSTYLAAGATLPGTPPDAARGDFAPVAPVALWRLPADLGRRYRAVSGDPNPIHTSRIAARALGFPRPIAHGMWTHARALAALENRLPAGYRVGVDFTKPLPLPATVGFSASARSDGWDAAVTTRDGAKPYLLVRIDTTTV